MNYRNKKMMPLPFLIEILKTRKQADCLTISPCPQLPLIYLPGSQKPSLLRDKIYNKANGGGWQRIDGALRTVQPNEWTHVAVVKDGDQVSFYVDGVSHNGGTVDNDHINSDPSRGMFQIGSGYQGSIDNLSLWKKASLLFRGGSKA
ncbi:LamG domain-containing protein [Salibacterium sp. K-3]